jgi:hypothetical protein
MGRDGVYPVETSKVGSLLHYVIAYLGYSEVNYRPWTSLLDTHHPDPWHAPVAVTTVYVLLMMDAVNVRNMLSDLAVINKQYCQSCIKLVPCIIYVAVFIQEPCSGQTIPKLHSSEVPFKCYAWSSSWMYTVFRGYASCKIGINVATT